MGVFTLLGVRRVGPLGGVVLVRCGWGRYGFAMADPIQILLAEDDVDLQVTTRLVLEKFGYSVVVAGDGQKALDAFTINAPDLLLVDVMMPVMDGISLTRAIRARSDVPIIMLTARDLSYDQVMGLEAGADDYITKPFNGEVLNARIQALLRRARHSAEAVDEVRVGDLAIDRIGWTVNKAGADVELSATEFRLLEAFLDHRGAVLSRTQLLDRVWGSADWGDERVVDVNIQRLRAKIGNELITTVRGAGYKMVRE